MKQKLFAVVYPDFPHKAIAYFEHEDWAKEWKDKYSRTSLIMEVSIKDPFAFEAKALTKEQVIEIHERIEAAQKSIPKSIRYPYWS